MAKFGVRSQQILSTCDDALIAVCERAIEIVDFSVLRGAANKDEQNTLYAQGRTMPGDIVTWVRYPYSKHNVGPEAGRTKSVAVDIAPYPIDWNDLDRFRVLAGIVLGIGHALDIPLRWGGDWKRNFLYENQRRYDMPHFELMEE